VSFSTSFDNFGNTTKTTTTTTTTIEGLALLFYPSPDRGQGGGRKAIPPIPKPAPSIQGRPPMYLLTQYST